MGFESPADQKMPIRVGDWNAMKLALWRGKIGWEIARHAAAEIVMGCKHVKGCPGAKIETEPCYAKCPDREVRMSALVILNAARTCMPDGRKPAEGGYFAPSREYFSEVLAKLGVAEIENEALREALRRAGVEAPEPPAVPPPALPRKAPAQFEETNT